MRAIGKLALGLLLLTTNAFTTASRVSAQDGVLGWSNGANPPT